MACSPPGLLQFLQALLYHDSNASTGSLPPKHSLSHKQWGRTWTKMLLDGLL